MMLAGTLFLVVAQEEKTPDPKAFLRTTMQQVQRAKSFEATIEHHESSVSFPGEYVVHLRWQSGVGFDIVATDRGTATSSLPNYYSRGKTVTSVFRDMRRMTESTTTRPFITPGWEVLGGLNFSFLAKSSFAEFLFAEPKPPPKTGVALPPDQKLPEPVAMTYVLGERRNWKGQSVREIVAKSNQSDAPSFSIFLHPTSRYVIGIEMASAEGEPGWLLYRDIKINGAMPSDLGEVPGG